MGRFLFGAVDHFFCRDVSTLARSFRVERFRNLDLLPTLLALLVVGTCPAAESGGNAPVRHRAVRILLRNLAEGGFGGFKSEGMQQGDTAFKGFVDARSTGRWEVHGTKLLLVELLVVMCVVGR